MPGKGGYQAHELFRSLPGSSFHEPREKKIIPVMIQVMRLKILFVFFIQSGRSENGVLHLTVLLFHSVTGVCPPVTVPRTRNRGGPSQDQHWPTGARWKQLR